MASNKQKNLSVRKKFAAGEKKSRHAMEEFGPGKGEFILCPKDDAVYYKKSWHHASDFFLRAPSAKKEKRIRFKLCPAHEMMRRGQHEGEIIFRNVPKQFFEELRRLVENMGEQAYRMDVTTRILSLDARDQTLRVTVSENQLAQKIMRKIKRTFRTYIQETEITRGKEGDSVRITVNF
ncbi:MAG: hypothetical protein HYZ69_01905 [Candidatus Colwellbacteria bacterium]|nr:hypothetical protein [Candidatus Colwellbacteria bacterium]